MKILDFIKQLKLIEPDSTYSENSKRAIMASPVLDPAIRLRPRVVLLRLFETAIAAGLGALLIVFVTGGFSGTSISPAPFAAVNPSTLRAEAQAIDIQIKLANLAYQESTSTNTESTTASFSGKRAMAFVVPTDVTPSNASGTPAGDASSTATTTVSIDDTLQQLSQ